MTTTIMIVHAFISLFLIISVLLQFGKGAEAGLMGGSSDSVFTSSQQGNILSKITTVLAILFVANCILLAKLQSGRKDKSSFDTDKTLIVPKQADSAADSASPNVLEKTKEEATPETKEEAVPTK